MPESIGERDRRAERTVKTGTMRHTGHLYSYYETTDGRRIIFNPNDPVQERKAKRLAAAHQRTLIGGGG